MFVATVFLFDVSFYLNRIFRKTIHWSFLLFIAAMASDVVCFVLVSVFLLQCLSNGHGTKSFFGFCSSGVISIASWFILSCFAFVRFSVNLVISMK